MEQGQENATIRVTNSNRLSVTSEKPENKPEKTPSASSDGAKLQRQSGISNAQGAESKEDEQGSVNIKTKSKDGGVERDVKVKTHFKRLLSGHKSKHKTSKSDSQENVSNGDVSPESALSNTVVEVDIETEFPDLVWDSRLKGEIGCRNIQSVNAKSLFFSSWEESNVIRFVCISDTHGRAERRRYDTRVPNGDVLLHAGDFTMHGDVDAFEEFNQFLGKLPHRIKLVVPGNHDQSLDPRARHSDTMRLRRRLGLPIKSVTELDYIEPLKNVISNAKVLMDNLVEICGIKIYGTPWIPHHCLGFGLPRGLQLLEKYEQIPAGVDILMTHGPPLGFGDFTTQRKHVGCVELLNSVRKRIKPKYLVYGHIHEGYGVQTDGTTTYINAAVCNKNYHPVNDPIVFDYIIPPPYTREDMLLLSLSDLKLS